MKTNRLNTKALWESSLGRQLKSIHVPSPVCPELRHLTQRRDTMIGEGMAIKVRIKAPLFFDGIQFLPTSPGSQCPFIAKAKLRKPPGSNTDQLLDSLEFCEKQALKTTQEIGRLSGSDPKLSQCVQYLMTIPGIG